MSKCNKTSAITCINITIAIKGEKIYPIAWEVIESLELYKIPVTSLTSDGAKQNRRFYRLCQPQGNRELPYKCVNIFREDTDLYFFCDAPHLLKTTRNCFSNSFSHSKSRKMQVAMYNSFNKPLFHSLLQFLIRKRVN